MATALGPAAPKINSDVVTGAPTRPTKVTPVPIPVPGSVSPLPPSGGRSSAAGKLPSSTNSTVTTEPSIGFGLLAPADSNLQDAANGPHRDGRVRNPVPSKLKGKTDGSKGNFSVMHLEVAGRSEATERDAQAKRTSESTELAARRAFENGYVSLRRSRFVHLPDEAATKLYVPPSTLVQASSSSSRQAPLNPEETKSEQARLLTLLRSLHPVLIVDQICKALAFFGGIPGAPPPADGVFPQSAEANGSGSLFVGWVSEIFPKVGGNASQQQRAISPAGQLDAPEVTKRRRGRPKGSKATKARKDKGIKKGTSKASLTAGQAPSAEAEESWVDIDESAIEISDDVDANVMLLAQAASPHRTPISNLHLSTSQETTTNGQSGQATAGQVRTALPGGGPAESDSVVENGSAARKRGRPKGSKNRPKDSTGLPANNASSSQPTTQAAEFGQAGGVPSVQQIYHPAQDQPAAINPVVPVPASVKKKGNRPKASMAKHSTTSQPSGPTTAVTRDPETITSGNPSSTEAPPALDAQSASLPNNQYGQQQYQQQRPFQAPAAQALQPLSTPGPPKAVGSGAQKRKRKGGKDAEGLITNPQNQGSNLTVTTGLMTSSPTTNIPPSQPQVLTPTVGPPPAKRQRKGKGDSTQAPAQNQNDYPVGVGMTTSSAATAGVTSPIATPLQIPVAVTVEPRPMLTPASRRGPESATATAPPPVEQTMSSVHSPHHGHFEVQSPTMENYEAQLQAQLEQQTEPEPKPTPSSATQSRLGSVRLISSHLQPQQQFQQRQQSQSQSQQQQQNHGQQLPAPPNRSPNPPPSQLMKSQTASPIATQQQSRTPQPAYTQYRSSNTHFGQQHQQNYAATQTQQAQHQRFTGQSQTAQVTTQNSQSQQYPSNTQQQFSATQQYNNTHQLGSQQRYQQQLGTSSAGTTTYSAQHSPQFGPSANNTFGATDATYRNSTGNLNTSQYTSQRSQSGTPSTATTYRPGATGSSHGLPQHSPPFSTDSSSSQQRSTSAVHSQGIHSMASVQSFPGNPTNEWGLFDTSSLDSSSSQNTLGLNSSNYGISSASVRAPSNATAGFASNALGSFDTSALGGNDRFYGVGRR